MKRRLVRAALAGAALLVAGALLVVSGVVPVTASAGHWPTTIAFLRFARQRSVATHSIGIEAPPLDDPRLVRMGAGHFHAGCAPCHGAPGVRRWAAAHGLTPSPPELAEPIGASDDGELFYIVLHGVKLTGMPAWPAQQREDEVWALVAFMRRLPALDADGYARLVRHREASEPGVPDVVGDVCARCHGADGLGGPDGAFPRLAGQRREYLEGALEAYASGARHSGIMETVATELADDEIAIAAAWYAARPPVRVDRPEPDARGEAIARRGIPDRRIPACAECHGPGGGARHAAYPILAGQHAHYLEQQLRLFVHGQRGGSEFARVMRTAVAAHGLEPDEIGAVARFYASSDPSR